VILQNGSKSLEIMTETQQPMRLGDLADASGFPDVRDGFLTLTRSEVRDSQVQAPVAPVASNWQKLASSGNIFDLVSIEGTVLMEVREATMDNYVVLSEGHIFSAVFRHGNIMRQASLGPMKQSPLGSRVRVTGICMNLDANPFNGPVPFNILMRTVDDIIVVARPGLFTVRNLSILVGFLLAVVLVVGARGWALDRKVRQKTAALASRIEAEAALERRRSTILEHISENRPLEGILVQVTRMISEKLGGVPCWCETAGKARLLGHPPGLESLRIARAGIVAHTGEPLGTVFAAFPPSSQPSAVEFEALDSGARIAALAIESHRLYADLRHRSEFDQLTDIHNRFSMENQLEEQILRAQSTAAVFGLIYIDLDGFKQINDRLGHHAGDVYLQIASNRMTNQLRPMDMLARLGGDEFGALLPDVHSRAEVEEIAQRLEQCFDKPFSVEGALISGSASVGIALYPQDGTSKDDLLQAADAAMYTAKHNKREIWPAMTASERSGNSTPIGG
jgi:diguanylate cyclase (GGDEF)-like protein